MEYVVAGTHGGARGGTCTGAHGGAKLPTALDSTDTKGFSDFQTLPGGQRLSKGVALLASLGSCCLAQLDSMLISPSILPGRYPSASLPGMSAHRLPPHNTPIPAHLSSWPYQADWQIEYAC